MDVDQPTQESSTNQSDGTNLNEANSQGNQAEMDAMNDNLQKSDFEEKKRKIFPDSSDEDEDLAQQKPKKKLKSSSDVKKYFDDEADESEGEDAGKTSKKTANTSKKGSNIMDDDEDEESGDDEDENNYKFGDFVVEDGFESNEESDDGKLKKSKRELSRLKKKKGNLLLDEDDLLLIEDNRQQQRGLGGKGLLDNDDDDDVIAPIRVATKTNKVPRAKSDEDDGDLDVDDDYDKEEEEDDEMEDDLEGDEGRNFVVDEKGEEYPSKKKSSLERMYPPTQRSSSKVTLDDGPTIDQLQDAREIFGDAFEFDDLDDDDLDDVYDDLDEDEDEANKKPKSKEAQILATLRKRFDRSQLVASFCTSKDDDIRRIDRPERLQSILPGRETPSEVERQHEAEWISQLLIEKIHEKAEHLDVIPSDLHTTVNIVLKYIQVDNFEVPFIYTYRRDYLHPCIGSSDLWYICKLDEKWEHLFRLKAHVLKMISTLQDAAMKSQYDIEAEKRRHRALVRNVLDDIERLTNDVKVASMSEDDAQKIVDSNDDDDEETQDNDKRRLHDAKKRHGEVLELLKQKQLELSHARLEEDEIKRKSEMAVSYDPHVAEEVLRLFPAERYIPMVENAKEDIEVKDVLLFVGLLIRGAQGFADRHKDSEDREFNSASQEEKANAKKATAGGKDKYSKLLVFAPSLRQLVEYVSVPVYNIGDAVRHGMSCHVPSYPTATLEELAKDYVRDSDPDADLYGGTSFVSPLQSVKQVTTGIEWILATELSHEPSIRQHARRLFKQYATISTRPTDKGLLTINPFSNLFGIHFLDKKPVSDIYERGSKYRTLFIRLSEAQTQGLIKTPPSAAYADPSVRESWDRIRESVLKILFTKLLPTTLENELKRDLMRLGRETIVEEAGQNFANRFLSVGPFRPMVDVKEDLKSVLTSCPKRPYYGSVMSIFISGKDPLYMTYIDCDGVLRGHDLLPGRAMDEKRSKLKDFMTQYKPETIAINLSGGMASKDIASLVEKDLIREVQQAIVQKREEAKAAKRKKMVSDDDYSDNDVFDDGDEEDDTPYTANVCLVNDDVALIYRHSPRAKKQFPELQPGAAAAICLGRYVQEPLAEFCNMFWSADATDVFGYELLFLDLHEHKTLLRGSRIPLIRELERRLVDAVNTLGVDINEAVSYDHLAGMLGFICGLGLRKGDALRNAVRARYRYFDSRQKLLDDKLLGYTVYTNAVGFLRIQPESYNDEDDEEFGNEEKSSFFDQDGENSSGRKLNPLDNTRIHPECYVTYEFAQKLCGNALDKEYSANDYFDVVISARKNSRAKLLTQVKTKWLDLWLNYTYPTEKTYMDDFMVKQTSEIITKTFTTELRDKLHVLDLDEYLEELEKTGKGKRRLQCEMIKEELRYPWLDLRAPMPAYPTSTEMFKILTNETDYSLHIGLKVGCKVTRIMESGGDGGGRFSKRIQKALVKTDSGLRGQISAFEILDERWDSDRNNIRDYLNEGKDVVGVVVGVNKDRMTVDISIKPSHLTKSESWWIKNRNESPCLAWFQQSILLLCNQKPPQRHLPSQLIPKPNIEQITDLTLYDPFFLERDALEVFERAEDLAKSGKLVTMEAVLSHDKEAKENNSLNNNANEIKNNNSKKSRMRNIYHPLFANVDFKEAEARLLSEARGAGEVIFRPSSKGMDHLTITWAFTAGSFKHIDIEEKGKTNANDVGKELYVRDGDSKLNMDAYADLDEIYSRYIEPMNDYVSIMMKSRYFQAGSPEQVEDQMRTNAITNPARIPYFIRLEPNKPGYFCLTSMSLNLNSTNPIKKELILVTPNGYRWRGQTFPHPDKLINFFKESMAKASQPQPVRSNPSLNSYHQSNPDRQPQKSRFRDRSDLPSDIPMSDSRRAPLNQTGRLEAPAVPPSQSMPTYQQQQAMAQRPVSAGPPQNSSFKAALAAYSTTSNPPAKPLTKGSRFTNA